MLSRTGTITLQELYEKAAAGDASAEDELFRKLTERFIRILGHKLRRSRYEDAREYLDDLRDVAQEAVITTFKIYRREKIDAFAPWTQRVLDFVFRKWLSRDLRRRERFLREDYRGSGNSSGAYYPDPAAIGAAYTPPWLRRDLIREVCGAMGRMPDDYRKVMLMLMRESDIGEIMAQFPRDSAGAVYTRISRARKRLRDLLGEKRELFDSIVLSDHHVIGDIIAVVDRGDRSTGNG